jgi:hypothetical protein
VSDEATNPRPPRKSQPRRRRANRSRRPPDLWRNVPDLPEPAPIAPAEDPSALLRSLGDPPLQGQANTAQGYMLAVVERAAGLATALAAAADLLAAADDV